MKALMRRTSLFVIPLLAAWLVRSWFVTCRIHEHDVEHLQRLRASGTPFIGTAWHYCVLGIFTICRKLSGILMISASADGDYLAGMAERLGYSVVRGSSNRKGAAAAKELIRELRRGKNSGLVADGSQGPARIAQLGPLWLAARAGVTILPFVYSASSYYTFNTWDRLILPKPFSRMDVFYGQPMTVPADVKMADMEEFRQKLEDALNTLYDRAWEFQGKEHH
ncbi:MAG TPA: lysophospholipid acyltransferase family protein [Desulfopila sp.]|nr:lysophospholipid acyltransferase family protein [Desulfopila sp.]